MSILNFVFYAPIISKLLRYRNFCDLSCIFDKKTGKEKSHSGRCIRNE